MLVFVAPAFAFEMTKPYLVRSVEAGEQRFGELVEAEEWSPGLAALAFADGDLTTWVAVADEPCGGGDCLADVRILALGTAGGQGVETVVSWSDGLGHPLGETRVTALSATSVAWLAPSSRGRVVTFSGTETEFTGSETELSPEGVAAISTAVALDHAGSSPDPLVDAAVSALAAAVVAGSLAGAGS